MAALSARGERQPSHRHPSRQRARQASALVYAGRGGRRHLGDGNPAGQPDSRRTLDGGAPPDTLAVPGSSIAAPKLSPDGRWLLYTSNETGENEVWVTTLDGSGVRHRISTGGGMRPLWTRGGREIVYRDVPAVLAVSFDPGTGPRGRPVELFRGDYVDSGSSEGPDWDVSADGEMFYMVRETGEPPRRISIITNFFEVLRERAGG